MQPLYSWLEATWIARTVGQSVWLTGGFSAAHAIGFTLIMSAGVTSNLRAAGLLLSARPLAEIVRPATRLLIAGLLVSLPTGLVLFSPRASYTGPSGVFQLKVSLILIAAIFQFVVAYRVLKGRGIGAERVLGAVGVLLWLSLAGVACWFVLFE